MARLPKPGSDSGKWGDILNDYLTQSHNTDGTIKVGAVSKATVGLDNVDNTSDVNKPISAATQAALDAKLTASTLDAQTAAKIQDDDSATAAALAERYGVMTVGSDALLGAGHSMMEAVGTDWISTLGGELGVTVTNAGKSGWSSTDIAVLVGAIDPLLTVTGNQIPASGAVTVTAVSPTTSYRVDGTGVFSYVGTLCGVAGTLTRNNGTATWTFTRTTAGAVVACPAASAFHCTTHDDKRDRVLVLWNGVNNLNAGGVLTDASRDAGQHVRHLLAAYKRALILGELTDDNDITGTANHDAIVSLATTEQAQFGLQFVDVRRYLIDYGLDTSGLAPTSQDRIDIASDTVPLSLRADALHPNGTGYGIVRQLVRERIAQFGWLAGCYPTSAPGQVTGLAAGTATTSTIPVTFSVVTGATGYRVEYRKTGAATWLWGTSSASGSATVSGLQDGTSYEIRVLARNIAGYGTASSTLTQSTAGSAPTLLYSDQFSRADGNLTGSTSDGSLGGSTFTWGAVSNDVKIISNTVGRGAGTTVRYPAGPNVGTVGMRVVVKATTLGSDGIMVAMDSTGANGAYLTISSNLQFVTRTGGSSGTAYPAGTCVAGDEVALKVSSDGLTLTAYVNGLQTGTVTLGAALTNTYAGLRIGSGTIARTDDFRVYDK